MEELSAIWTNSEESAYDLKQKILSTNLELESVKNLATESQENANKLFELLQVAYKERDVARNELQKILNKINYSTSAPVDDFPNVVQPESPILIPPKENSCIFESNNLFESCLNPQLHDSLLIDSLFDSLPSSNFLNINYSSNIKTTMSMSTGLMASSGLDATFDYIAQGKSLPEKGKLMQAVMEAGPLLQTLLVTGPPLPQWRNPHTMLPPKIPSISLQGCKENIASSSEKLVATTSSSNFLNSISYPGVSQTCSTAMLDIMIPSVPSCKRSMPLNSSSYFVQQIPTAKKCRLQ